MTVERVSILQSALDSLLRAKGPRAGVLIGLHDSGNALVLSAAFCTLDELAATRDAVNTLLPAPLTVLGAHTERQEDVAAAHRMLGAGSLAAVPSSADGLECFFRGQPGSRPASVVPSGSDPVADALAGSYVPVRCSMDLVLQAADPVIGRQAGAEAGSQQGPSREAVAASFAALRRDVCSPGTVYLAEAAASSAGGDGQGAQLMRPDAAAIAIASWDSPLSLRAFCTAGGSGASCAAPSMQFVPGRAAVSCAALHLDVLCYVPKAGVSEDAIVQAVRSAVASQLSSMEREQERRGGDLVPLRALHFLPPGLPHHIALIYPLPTPSIEADEEALLGRRLQLHALLGLPANRPLLRVANSLDWRSAAAAAGGGVGRAAGGGVGGKPRLADVHAGLAPSGVGGSVHLVQGTYDYYHYMQDKFDDSGWGCAYRSLQTICSWFAKQLYTSQGVPTHREIQQTLVSIGDKQAAFIGSRQWIGAIELGFVLDTLLGVQCKVLTVASGADMPGKAREIAHHFDTQGTPIMIGGGVLAYTLLGIDFNERTGDCAFLILDPHYTGPEDLKRIHAGQWVAWKKLGDKAAAGGELFVAEAFYNLLCPQRPSTV